MDLSLKCCFSFRQLRHCSDPLCVTHHGQWTIGKRSQNASLILDSFLPPSGFRYLSKFLWKLHSPRLEIAPNRDDCTRKERKRPQFRAGEMILQNSCCLWMNALRKHDYTMHALHERDPRSDRHDNERAHDERCALDAAPGAYACSQAGSPCLMSPSSRLAGFGSIQGVSRLHGTQGTPRRATEQFASYRVRMIRHTRMRFLAAHSITRFANALSRTE